MLELPGATRKLSSNLAKRMRLRSLQLMERCNPLGQALGWMAARPERRHLDRHWRHTPNKETNSWCRSTRVYLPRSKTRATQREPGPGSRKRWPSHVTQENTGATL